MQKKRIARQELADPQEAARQMIVRLGVPCQPRLNQDPAALPYERFNKIHTVLVNLETK
jgi:hypothetical protein